jgi:hypothetical protein
MRIEVVPLLLENELGLHELLVLERLEPIALALDLLELTTAQLLVLAPRLELRLLVRLLFGEELRLLIRDLRLLLGEPREDKFVSGPVPVILIRVTANYEPDPPTCRFCSSKSDCICASWCFFRFSI